MPEEAPLPEINQTRFFCHLKDKTEGPFDLIELAAQIKYSIIDGDTLVYREGMEKWAPFRELPEFVMAREMSVEKIAWHLEEKERTGSLSPVFDQPPASRRNYFTIIALFFVGVVVLALGLFLGQSNLLPGWLHFEFQKPSDFVFAKEYRAEVEIKAGTRQDTELIYMDNGKSRMESESRNAPGFTIVRPDTNKLYYVMPNAMAYYDRTYAPDGVDRSTIGIPLNYTRLGPEIMNGIPCIKYLVTVDGNPYYLWADIEKQVPVKSANPSGDVTMIYKSYQPGPQDASLFEPPPNYSQRQTDSNLPRLIVMPPTK